MENRSTMSYDQEALECRGEKENYRNIEAMLQDMESDFASCARGRSPCFFCRLDDTCTCTNDKDCKFEWKPHK